MTESADLLLDPSDSFGSDPQVRYFETRFSPDVEALRDENLRDAAVLAYEYETRRLHWWSWRLPVAVGLVVITGLSLILWLLLLILGNSTSGLFLWLFVVGLVVSLLFAGYCWLTLPRLTYFGRHYRRLIATPLSQSGLVWSDPSLTPPDFPSLRDTFYALYRDSDDLSSQMRTDMQYETERKKLLLGQLSRLLTPLLEARAENTPTPFMPHSKTAVLDEVNLSRLSDPQLAEVLPRCLPPQSISPDKRADEFGRLALEIEDYSGLKTDPLLTPDAPNSTSGIFTIAASDLDDQPHSVQMLEPDGKVTLIETVPEVSPEVSNSQTIHQQITQSVNRNLGLAERETERWKEHAARERDFEAKLLSQYKGVEQVVADGYNRITVALEDEVRPALDRLSSDSEFYQNQISKFYFDQRLLIEGARDNALGKLEREHNELVEQREQLQYDLNLAEAELNRLVSRRNQLDTSTDQRFASLKQQLHDLTTRTYNLNSPPHFQSDATVPASTTSPDEIPYQLADLLVDTRSVTKTANTALNRYAVINFDTLDDLGQLEHNLANSNKWQAVRWLDDAINFKRSGQLLELASEVSNAVSNYVEACTEFERLNQRWNGLATAVGEMGMTKASIRLDEAQQNLGNLDVLLQSLYSSLIQAPHSPEMARPATFQNLYDGAAGLRRELEELGGLAGSITYSQERVAALQDDVGELDARIAQNEDEDNRMRQEAASRIVTLTNKQNLIMGKLDEQTQARRQKIRSHIVALEYERDGKLTELQTGAVILSDGDEISSKILQKHLTHTDQLLDEIHRLQQNLEQSLEGMVAEFEQSVVLERCLPALTEVYVPVWLCHFEERPLWNKVSISKASCYKALTFTPASKWNDVKTRPSFWKFILSRRSTTSYILQTDPALNALVEANQLQPPSQQPTPFSSEPLEHLLRLGWVNSWFAPFLHQAISKS